MTSGAFAFDPLAPANVNLITDVVDLEHLRGEPWARIGEQVGQRNLAVTANTYTHVLSDERELDYQEVLRP